MFIMNLNLSVVIFIIELHLKTFEVMFVRMLYIVIDFIFIRKLYLL